MCERGVGGVEGASGAVVECVKCGCVCAGAGGGREMTACDAERQQLD